MKTLVSALAVLATLTGITPPAFGFGYQGTRGFDGRDGRRGQDGPSHVIYADGSAAYLDLSGTRGGDAEPGQEGGSAYACVQDYPDMDVHGAHGGDGGRGGNGGNGGSSGALTVHYTDIGALRNLFVVSQPGRGGDSARGGPGGYGCYCTTPSWQRRYCDANGQNCTVRTFHCHNGYRGLGGYSGGNGFDGRRGELTLIPQRDPVTPTNPDVSVPIGSLDTSGGTLVHLSESRWVTRSGASLLFAPGSVVPDAYRSYEGRTDRVARVLWQAGRSVTDFADRALRLHLTDGSIDAELDDDLWPRIREATQGPLTTFSIEKLIYESEARQLELVKVTGQGQDLVAEFVDHENVSSFVGTSFHLDFQAKRLFYGTKFHGAIPPSLVQLEGTVLRVAVGKLPIAAKWLKAGRKIRLRFEVVRALGEHSTRLSLGAKHRI